MGCEQAHVRGKYKGRPVPGDTQVRNGDLAADYDFSLILEE